MTTDDLDEQTEAGFRMLLDEMIAAWAEAAGPSPRLLESGERAELAEIGASSVVWAWTNRVVRTARAALVLHDHDFDVEASPLRRSLFEHAEAIHWLADKRGPAYQALVRARSLNMKKFKTAQDAGWSLNEEQQEPLDEAISIETDDDTRSQDTYLNAKQRAEAYGLGSVHQGWLIETWTSHPTLMSALPYFDQHEESLDSSLYEVPKPMARAAVVAACAAVHVALSGYERLVPNAFGGKLEAWQSRFAELGDQLRTTDPSEPSVSEAEAVSDD